MSIPTSFPGGFTTALFALKNAISRSSCPLPVAIKPSPSPMSIRAGTTTGELNSWGAAHGPLWDAIRAKGRRVEVIAIGAELDVVLRADRMLQLWAAAEPGKVATGLTVKQEISAIREALHNGNREFLEQYGGMNQGAERYKELLILPEAELTEGVSIDDYSTYRATRFSEPV